jgi:diguanylate cyclase (GGDEF)-like protein
LLKPPPTTPSLGSLALKNRKLRFVIALAFLVLSGFIITSFISYFVAHDSITRQIEETTLPLTSDNIYSEIQRDLLRPIFISSLMAQDTFLRDWVINGEPDEAAIIRYLAEIQNRYHAISSFFVSEKTRNYYHPTGILKKIDENDPQDSWYFRVQKLQNDYEINVDTDTADSQTLAIFINYRVYDYEGRYLGTTGIGLGVSAVKNMIEMYQKRYGRQIYFIDREGNIKLQSNDYNGPANIRDIQPLQKLATRILTNPSYSLSYEVNNHTIYLNTRLVNEFNWFLVVEQIDDPAHEEILSTLKGNLVVSVLISLIVLYLLNLTINKYQYRLEKMASTDKLTGISSRQVFDMLFDQACSYSKRSHTQLTAIMLDIDHFKRINDNYGHLCGDEVIKSVARTTRSLTRDTDVLCRWGGEEFLLLLSDSNLEQAQAIAEKIREAIAMQRVVFGNKRIDVTASFGIAQLLPGESKNNLIKRADNALYTAKELGRNRVAISSL